MSDIFDEDDNLADEAYASDEKISIDNTEAGIMDARRRLEKKLEEKRLRDELDDFGDLED